MNRTTFLAFLSLVLPACAAHVSGESDPATGSTSLQQLAASATELHFWTSTGIPQNPAPDVNLTVSDPDEVSALFEAAIALPVVPPGQYNCPADFGVTYHLAFTSGSTTTVFALDPSGCGWLTTAGYPSRAPSGAFWSQLASTLGVPETTIYPLPLPPSSP